MRLAWIVYIPYRSGWEWKHKKSVFHTGRYGNETNKRLLIDVDDTEVTMATADEEKQKLMEGEEKAEAKQDKKDGTRCES